MTPVFVALLSLACLLIAARSQLLDVDGDLDWAWDGKARDLSAASPSSRATSLLHAAIDRLQMPEHPVTEPLSINNLSYEEALDRCLYEDSGRAKGEKKRRRKRKRLLVFTYHAEQRINGFGAMYQWWASVLPLAHRYGRTMVELHPVAPPARAISQQQGAEAAVEEEQQEQNANGSGGEYSIVGRLRYARDLLKRATWVADAAASGEPWGISPADAAVDEDDVQTRKKKKKPATDNVGNSTNVTAGKKGSGSSQGNGSGDGDDDDGAEDDPSSLLAAASPTSSVPLSPQSLYARLVRDNDVWRRSPPGSCGGAKAGCYFDAPTRCGVTVIDDDVVRMMKLAADYDAVNASSSSGINEGLDMLVDEVHGSRRLSHLLGRSIPFLDVVAEEARLVRKHLGKRRKQLGGGGDGHEDSDDGQDEDEWDGQDASEAPIVRVDNIVSYRPALLAVTAGIEPAEGIWEMKNGLEQAEEKKAKANAKAKETGALNGASAAVAKADSKAAQEGEADAYHPLAQTFRTLLRQDCALWARCISWWGGDRYAATNPPLLLVTPLLEGDGSKDGGLPSHLTDDVMLEVNLNETCASQPLSATLLQHSLYCPASDDDLTWTQRMKSFSNVFISKAWEKHKRQERERIARLREERRLLKAQVRGEGRDGEDKDDKDERMSGVDSNEDEDDDDHGAEGEGASRLQQGMIRFQKVDEEGKVLASDAFNASEEEEAQRRNPYKIRTLVLPAAININTTADSSYNWPFVRSDDKDENARMLLPAFLRRGFDTSADYHRYRPYYSRYRHLAPNGNSELYSDFKEFPMYGSRSDATANGGERVQAWQRLWFPAYQSYLFRPRPMVKRIEATNDEDYSSGSGSGSGSGELKHERHQCVALHYRQGDAAIIFWRSKASLEDYARQATLTGAVIAKAHSHGTEQSSITLPSSASSLPGATAPAAAASTTRAKRSSSWSLVLASDSATVGNRISGALQSVYRELSNKEKAEDATSRAQLLGAEAGLFLPAADPSAAAEASPLPPSAVRRRIINRYYEADDINRYTESPSSPDGNGSLITVKSPRWSWSGTAVRIALEEGAQIEDGFHSYRVRKPKTDEEQAKAKDKDKDEDKAKEKAKKGDEEDEDDPEAEVDDNDDAETRQAKLKRGYMKQAEEVEAEDPAMHPRHPVLRALRATYRSSKVSEGTGNNRGGGVTMIVKPAEIFMSQAMVLSVEKKSSGGSAPAAASSANTNNKDERVTDSNHRGLRPTRRTAGEDAAAAAAAETAAAKKDGSTKTSKAKKDAHVHLESWIKNSLDRGKKKAARLLRKRRIQQREEERLRWRDDLNDRNNTNIGNSSSSAPLQERAAPVRITSGGEITLPANAVQVSPTPPHRRRLTASAAAKASSSGDLEEPSRRRRRYSLSPAARSEITAYLRHLETSTAFVPTVPLRMLEEADQLAEEAKAKRANSTAADRRRRPTRRPEVRVFPIFDPLGTVPSGQARAFYPHQQPTFPMLPEALQLAKDALEEASLFRDRPEARQKADLIRSLTTELHALVAKATKPPPLPPAPAPVVASASASDYRYKGDADDAGDSLEDVAERLQMAADIKRASVTVQEMTSGVVADIDSLSKCQAVVGTCLSQVSRSVYELSYAKGNAILPPIGLDAESCVSLNFLPHPYAILAQWRGQVVLPSSTDISTSTDASTTMKSAKAEGK